MGMAENDTNIASTVENDKGIITRYIDEPLYVLDALEGRTGTRSDYYEHRTPADTDDSMKYRVEGEMALNPGECYTVDIEHDKYGEHTITLRTRELVFADRWRDPGALSARMIVSIDYTRDYFVEVPMTIIDGDWSIITDYEYNELITIEPLFGDNPLV